MEQQILNNDCSKNKEILNSPLKEKEYHDITKMDYEGSNMKLCSKYIEIEKFAVD